MSTFLHQFEAIESRIAFHLCPRGTAGRLHVLRLRRCFQQTAREGGSAASETRSAYATSPKDIGNCRHESTNGQSPTSNTRNGEQEKSSNVYNAKSHLVQDFAREIRPVKAERQAGWGYYRQNEPIRRTFLSETPSKLPATGHRDALRRPGFAGQEDTDKTAESRLYEALRMGNPHAILRAVMHLVSYTDVGDFDSTALRSIPASAFSEILRCLAPTHFVGGRYTKLYQDISPHYYNALGNPPVGDYRFRAVFLSQIRGIIAARNKSFALSLSDYRFLLGCARATANLKLASSVWKMMKERRIQPDLECYNHYLAVHCWSDNMNLFQQNRLRVIPINIEPRKWPRPPNTLAGHRVGGGGIKFQATTIFSDMARAGIGGNEETFCLLMTALAREGDIAGVASILKKVWDIEVEALANAERRRLQPLKTYTSESPFYPSQRLLYTLAHIYGINNAIPTALSIIDFVSQQYSLTIPVGVWKELLRWTYVLSADKKNREKTPPEDGRLTGQLPIQAVSGLWKTMTSEPYNVKPTMAMYDWIITNLIRRENFNQARLLMDQAQGLHKKVVQDYHHCKLLLADHVNRSGNLEERGRLSRDVQYAKLRWRRSALYLRKWANRLMRTMNHSLRHNIIWSTMDLPDIVRRWQPFLPNRIENLVEGGRVSFSSQSKHINRVRHWRFKKTARQIRSPLRKVLAQRTAQL